MTIANLLDPARLRRSEDAHRLPAMPRRLSLIAIASSVVAAAALAPKALAPLCAAIALWLPALAWSDIDSHRLPDALTRPMILSAITVAALTAATTGNYMPFVRSLVVAATTALVMVGIGLLLAGGPGLGDAKTAPALAMPLGWMSATSAGTWAITALALAAIWGSFQLVMTSRRRAGDHLPFGPAMIAAWFICLALS